jgi:hypothetical protein
LSLYDKAVEYVSGGSNVPDIKEFFWKWRRSHYPQTEHSLQRGSYNLYKSGDQGMGDLGIFGHSVADDEGSMLSERQSLKAESGTVRTAAALAPAPAVDGRAMNGARANRDADMLTDAKDAITPSEGMPDGGEEEPAVRSNFADTALWVGALQTDANGEAVVKVDMPENLTTWKARAWAMGDGTMVGEGTTEVLTTKNLIVRLQAPRFFQQKDEVVISTNVHNFLPTDQQVKVTLEMVGPTLTPLADMAPPADGVWRSTLTVPVSHNGERRVDWRTRSGRASRRRQIGLLRQRRADGRFERQRRSGAAPRRPRPARADRHRPLDDRTRRDTKQRPARGQRDSWLLIGSRQSGG